MNTVIVHGPQGSGKTQHAERLKRAFGCMGISDGWFPGEPVVPGMIHLTNVEPDPRTLPRTVSVYDLQGALAYAQGHGY